MADVTLSGIGKTYDGGVVAVREDNPFAERLGYQTSIPARIPFRRFFVEQGENALFGYF